MGCTLCPRRCGADRLKQAGFCGMGNTLMIARIAPHFDEEPCISGTRGSGAVFLSGCCLKCRYCQNGDISHRLAGQAFTPYELSEKLRALCKKDVHNINFVTPTHFTEQILQALALFKPPVPIVWNTSGYETMETLKRLQGVVDIYLPDLKHYSPKMSGLIAGAPDYFAAASQAISEMCRQTGAPVYGEDGLMQSGTLIRHLVLPGLTSESIRLLNWIKESLPPGTPVSLMRQYFPANGIDIKGLDRRLTQREYERVSSHMLALDLPGFTQEKKSADAVYVPAFNNQESF